MYFDDLIEAFHKEQLELEMFHDLGRYRVREVLLVASLYNSFVIKQDGALAEQIYGEFFSLNLNTIPRITCAYTLESAKSMFCASKYDLVILMTGLDFEGPLDLAKTLKAYNREIPILLLTMNNSTLASLHPRRDEIAAVIDRVFVWNGYSKLFVIMIKYLEDLRNVGSDTQIGPVQVILLVENSIRYYSRYLPILYSVVMNQTKTLVEEERRIEINKVRVMRWRPKILLATNYEEALDLFTRYEPFLLTVISDIRYSVNGIEDPEAGFKFLGEIRSRKPQIPVLMQSSDACNRNRAYSMGAAFADKNSNTLGHELTIFFQTHLGYGPFVFRTPDGRELSRAKNMDEFETNIRTIPPESLRFHGGYNHFSTWLMARGEIGYAKVLLKYSLADFNTTEDLRSFLLENLNKIRKGRARGNIPMLDSAVQNLPDHKLVLLGGGSLGGKGRGLVFIASLIENLAFTGLQEKMEIKLPYTAFIGIDEFDHFMEQNNLWGFSWFSLSETEIRKMFLSLPLDPAFVERLWQFLKTTNKPLAVRSSGLFEDVLMIPFSGVYDTYVIPNASPDSETRLAELCDAVRLIYASLYSESSRRYFEAASYKIEEERMAVIIQELVGTRQGKLYYPIISGIAQSYNYYPVSYLKPDDGLCIAALGLGFHVVEGGAAFRFSPRYPKLDVSAPGTRIDGTQRTFFALDMERPADNLISGYDATLQCLEISEAEGNRDFAMIASTLNREDDRLEPGTGGSGPRIINFAPILKYEMFPFAEVIDAVLEVGSKSMGLPVEIEFAVSTENGKPVFYFLQLKPLIQNSVRSHEVNPDLLDAEKCFVISGRSMGNGRDSSVCDIVWVDPGTFSARYTVDIAGEINELNNMLRAQNRHYILVGPGRWGTRDHALGVPVSFPQISFSRVIIETDLPDFIVESSQGSHFFHNVTSMNIGYLSVSPGRGRDRIDWEWLKSLPCERELQFCKWSRASAPLSIIMDGRSGNTVIYKN